MLGLLLLLVTAGFVVTVALGSVSVPLGEAARVLVRAAPATPRSTSWCGASGYPAC